MRKLLAITIAVAVTGCATGARGPASNSMPSDDFLSSYATSLPDLPNDAAIKNYILSLEPPAADAPRYPEVIHTQLTDRQKLTIQQITSIFENSTPVFQYDYIEDISDGAGVTAGRIGFTSAGHDLQQVIRVYLALKKNEATADQPFDLRKLPIATYLQCLEGIRGADYSCLYPHELPADLASKDFRSGRIATEFFGSVWHEIASDPVMHKVQDAFNDVIFYDKSVVWADSLGVRSALAHSAIYDVIVQTDSLPAVAEVTRKKFSEAHAGRASPANDEEEIEWLRYFQDQRKVELSKTESGAPTVTRVNALSQVLDQKNLALDLPLSFQYVTRTHTLAE